MSEEKIAAATVHFPKVGGQGVLIPSGMILTAAHCIAWAGDGRMVVGGDIIEEIETKDGQKLRSTALFVDPVADIAVLCGLDEQSFYKESEAFDEFCDATEPLSLSEAKAETFEKFPIRVLSHRGHFLSGEAMFCNPKRSSVWIETHGDIEAGTSGGPVVDESGKLIGVVSHACHTEPPRAICDGSIAFALRCLPIWLIEELRTQ